MLIRRATNARLVVIAGVVVFAFCPGLARAQQAESVREGLITEPASIERAVIFIDRRHGNGELTNGLYWDLGNMIPGAGWISGGPGYRRWYAKDRAVLDGSAAVSWGGYKTAQARAELPRLARSRLALGTQLRAYDFTHVRFYGEGADSRQSNRSEYRLRAKAFAGFVTLKPFAWASLDAELGFLRPSMLPRSGWFEGDHPDTRDVFPRNPVFATAEQPYFVHREASVTADTRDVPRHATRGGLYRLSAANYRASNAAFTFRRYEAEAAHFVPLSDSRVVLALHGWLVGSSTADDSAVPLYLLPSLGGHNTLRAYPDYRFHDRNLVAMNAEGRVALMTHVDAAVFFDAGNVAPRMGDLNFAKRSFGAGLRLHTRRQTAARLDIATGAEGWRLVVRLSDSLDLSRVSRRALDAPFVP